MELLAAMYIAQHTSNLDMAVMSLMMVIMSIVLVLILRRIP